jgi:hypothetical protein
MNTSLTAYTHLESLLLFQSLHAYGIAPRVFSRVSELLKSNPHITADKRFESGRLSPDALRNFYLHILKEEVKSERSAVDGEGTNGDGKGSRKRKAPSPSLPTVHESVQHQHLIPSLVNKLYARYRTALTDQIRHDEERYERLQRELHAIERGEWDDQLRERTNVNAKSASRSPSQSRKSPLVAQQLPEGPSKQHLQVESDTKLATGPLSQKKEKDTQQRGGSSTPQPHAGPVGHPSPAPLSQPPPPQLQPQQPSPATQNVSPVPARLSYPQSQFQAPGQNVSTSESLHLPQPIQPLVVNGVLPHTGASTQFSPTQQRFSGPHQLEPQSPSVQTPQQHRSYPSFAGQPPYPPQQNTVQPPPQGGFMLPPFQVSPQDPARAQQPIHPQYPQVATPVNARQSSARGTPLSANPNRQGVPPMHHLVTQARHSFSTPSGIRTPHSVISTPRSAKTLWKASARIFAGADVSRPEPEPIDDFSPSQTSQQSAPKAKAARKPRAKGKTKEKEPEPQPKPELEEPAAEVVPEMETRQGRSRRKVLAKRTRPGSIASSHAGTSARERSRSQSILSHTETIAADNESQAGSRIKSERANSIDTIEDTTPAPQMTTRRRGNLTASQSSSKRKRNARETSPEEMAEHISLPGLPQTVIAPRHFSRMCTPLMNDIGSHKHASTFTTAVKAKDAEGYYEIIKRPTDLKSIQKAIAVGAKQVAAAASGDTPAGSPGGGGGVVELPMTAENVPPKAIVNSAQLEKELMRMFVNAVMFNAGEDGVVEDAREMFETVQRSVSSWRSVERSSGRLEVEETPPVVEEDVPAASKRRKL